MQAATEHFRSEEAQQDQIPSLGALKRAGSVSAPGAAFGDHGSPGALNDGAPLRDAPVSKSPT